MATINQIPMTIMGNIVKDLEPKRTAGGKTVNLTIYTQKLTDADISMLLNLVNEKLGEDL